MKTRINIQSIKSQDVKDYSYAILFFVISAFFAFAIIKPVLSVAISLQKEADELKTINETYEKNISKILELQSDLESIREKKYLLEKALPNKPHLQEVINDIQQAAREEKILIQILGIQGTNLKNSQNINGLITISAQLNIKGNFTQVNRFIHNVSGQKRIKKIISVKMIQDKIVDGDDNLNLSMIMEVYYNNNEL
ncbi:hypothetical protein A3D06_01295 [Candidatus Roizmanbacteria bacterium RIFCSPHIGHO2_02_FULL_40_9]|uniref:Uncharacterized protein n=2 Tax=Candidatus Roizmaniibacteriota TaxID=1752723 RepID=A0A1F7IJY4_9BACT|nr:MAG: hypothetical protein A3D06_01295 [Candidatus Roizmanbacteria bacterium RIFCSPHIGHO2_02_FULL_40_9]OGK43678.1 MAG: hypothetical protein A2957_02925 [Candidatus Roizmanbacteria bacterium RIFCSPLOWO2_01_FULL_38_11]